MLMLEGFNLLSRMGLLPRAMWYLNCQRLTKARGSGALASTLKEMMGWRQGASLIEPSSVLVWNLAFRLKYTQRSQAVPYILSAWVLPIFTCPSPSQP